MVDSPANRQVCKANGVTPAHIGGYQILRRLGTGGMAEVFLARAVGASGFEKLVAIKRIREERRADGDLERLLIAEAKQGARLRHRNLVGVHELGVHDGGYFVVMEWIDGADLHSLGQASTETALSIASEVAEALSYLHALRDDQGRALGLVHRDVSPSNVLVSRSGEVKLADFGIAKATKLAETTQANLRRGKYAYMSPEQVRGEALTGASDQFALGIMLHEMLLGRRPYDGASPIDTMDRIREAEEPSLAGVDDDLARILRRCLASRPRERFESGNELVRSLVEARHERRAVTSQDVACWVQERIEGPAKTRARPRTRPLSES